MNYSALVWKNGQFLPDNQFKLSFADAGFVSATTITDYCRTYRQQLFRWADHIARFRGDCETIGIKLPDSDGDLTIAASQLVAECVAGCTPGTEISLITFATPGPIGYLSGCDQDGPPTLGMHAFAMPSWRYRRFFEDGVHLRWAGVLPSDAESIIPLAAKHRSRLHWHLAAQVVRHQSGAVAVLTDQFGRAADTAIGSVLVVIDEKTVVRPPHGTVLNGISMEVIRELCQQIGLHFATEEVNFRELPDSVSEMLLTGSAFGLAGVNSFSGPNFSRKFSWPGPICRALTTAWSKLVGLDIVSQFQNG